MNVPPTEPASVPPHVHHRGGVRAQLFRSHMIVAAIGLAVLVTVFIMTLQFRSAALRTALLRGPTARTSAVALQGVQRSLAGLRGWVTLNDPGFRAERASAWRDDIKPALGRLVELSADWPKTPNAQRLASATGHLKKLEAAQWWVEDVAQTPGNQPARALWDQSAAPRASGILSRVASIIELEEGLGVGADRKALLLALADFASQLNRSRIALSRIVASGREVDVEVFQTSLKAAEQRFAQISTRPTPLTEEQVAFLGNIQVDMRAYAVLAQEVIAARQSSDWNVARYRLREQAVPHANEATRQLADLGREQDRMMREDALRVVALSDLTIGVSILLFLAMLLASWFISRRSATRLAIPIVALSGATRRLADGTLSEDIPVTTEDELGDLTRAFNTMRARLERRTAEVLRAEKRFRDTVESSPTGIVMVDAQGTIVLVNRETEHLFGYTRDELLQHSIDMLVPLRFRSQHPGHRAAFMASPVVRPMGAGRELFGLRKDGTEFPVEIALNPARTDQGTFVLAAIVDITERKRMEIDLMQSHEALEESNVELQQFAYVASHDLQTPLRSIAGFVGLLQRRYAGKLDEQADRWIARAVDGTERMQTLIRDLLTYSRVDSRSRPFEPVDTNQAFENALALLEASIEDAGAEVTSDPLPTVYGDASQLVQLLQNLIGNGLKYHGEAAAKVHVSARRQGEEWEFSVRDNGIGIAPEHQERIFEILRRLHSEQEYPGTGIGLAVCRRVVQRHGGRIWVESEPGKGSDFRFTMPVGATEPC